MAGAYLAEEGRSAGYVSDVAWYFAETKILAKEKKKMRRIVFVLIEMIFFFWFFFPLLLKGIINVGNFAGMSVSAVLFFYTLKRERVTAVLAMLRANRGFCVAEWVVRISAVAVLLLFAVSAVRIAAAGYKKAPDAATPVIVLGCKVKGTRPSRILQERLDAADTYLAAHPDAVCVLSGGQGADEEISEASCMYTYLKEKGIARERLIREDRSVSTAENMKFSRQIFDARGMGREAVIITSEFHEYRARLLAEECGFTTYAYGASTDLLYFPTYFLREVLGVSYYTVRDLI